MTTKKTPEKAPKKPKDVAFSSRQHLFWLQANKQCLDLGMAGDVIDYLLAFGYEPPTHLECSAVTAWRNKQKVNAERSRFMTPLEGTELPPALSRIEDPFSDDLTIIEILGDKCRIGKTWRDALNRLADEAVKHVDRGVYGVRVGYYDVLQCKYAPNFMVDHKPFTAEQLRDLVCTAMHIAVETIPGECRLFLSLLIRK